ncbi:Isoleucyl-tRNA synthetase [Pseudarcicella hirudinis]|uniref:Isoleucine--tRNA ligase n=1 Tax=Pseudarcicella hirudinis TaxID=1079859 RepID=A0A1I5QL59_9BACT|nr:isoleucine--tRNA ligase [Pseudarcicella hirudinis]SFP46837.1 Isoleucyl-tRNA synthetase [Pseudarcicella hirudinis]
MNFKEYKNLDYAQVADDVLKFWQENKVFEKSVEIREGNPTFTFYEGPPSANGTPGIHHVMARAIKDIFCRYQTLKGKQVKRKGGWDTHGLPVELQVEKELGITKDDIGKKISVEEYNKKCRETVMKFTDQWNDLTEKMGYWVDLDDPYITYENNYIESVWHLLKTLYDKGLLYKGYTIQPYSPAAGTGLSSHELNQPGTYKDVKDTSLTAQFKVKLTGKSGFLFDAADSDNIYILAWTTTPWTLPANTALTVGKNIDYVLVKTLNPYTYLPVNVVLAKDLAGKYFNEKGKDGDFAAYNDGDKIIPWKVVMEFKGNFLESIEYEQLMPYVQPESAAFRVITGDFVTTEDGTGVVHTSPTFGADDFRVAQQNGIPSIMVKDEAGKDVPIVDRRGRFVAEITDFAHEFVKEAYLTEEEKEIEREKQGRDKYLSVDERIAIKLKTENKAFNVQRFDHPYPHCWRTDKPVLYYPLDSWFIRTTAAKDKLIALNNTINWKPESTGTGRFGNWLENLVDWNLSRSRYWGTPLPIWRSEDNEEVCIGSLAELENAIKHALKDDVLTEEQRAANEKFLGLLLAGTEDLHRPFVDEVYFVSASGKVMTRETDLIDVWFDSGAMPYAQWHYPFENHEIFEKAYPADFISEGVDQTRGWFFTLHAISSLVSDSVAFKNVVSTGLVLDKNGNKMSKRLGNAVNPFDTLKKYGADPTRWYMITNAQPWDNLKFDQAGITEVRNKFFGTLTNTYNFFALYANLDEYKINEFERVPYASLTELDRWILSKLQTLVKEVDESYENYEPTKAGRAIQDFVCDHLSNWYVRLGRRRFWKGEMTEDKKAAYETLQQCLVAVAQLMSPIAPFYGDWLYRNMTEHIREEAKEKGTPLQHESVHLTDYHPYEVEYVDEDLETSMDLAQRICSLVHSLRKTNKIKVRQPLSKILIPILSETTREQIRHVVELIKTEVNIKAVEYLDDASGVLSKKVKPNFKALGPKFGKDMKAVAAVITEMSAEQLKALEEKGGLEINGYQLSLEDVEIQTEDLPGYLTASDAGITVALDINITPELKQEGIARDFVNRVQNFRKDSGFEVTDKISIRLLDSDEEVSAGVLAFKDYISQEVQALSLEIVPEIAEGQEVEFEELTLTVKIEVV